MILRRFWYGDKFLIEICLACVEKRVLKQMPADIYIRSLDLPMIQHSCGIPQNARGAL